jgi:hypothetical protein
MPRRVLTALTVALLAIPAAASGALAAPSCAGLPATIVGDASSEIIFGTFRDDVIVSRGGNDTVFALGGNDVVCAGAGRDLVVGGRGDDQVFGDNGNDRLLGGAGFDALDGGAGRDRCRVGLGGGTATACEPGDGSGGVSDLSVDVSGPTDDVNDEEDFRFTVVVRNVGNAPSGQYTLIVTEDHTNVVCGFNPSESVQMPSLDAGQESLERSYRYELGCHVQSNSPGHVDLTVAVQPSGADASSSNDSDSASVTVDPPAIG